MQRYTVDEFRHEFPDDDACLEYLKELRWPDGITCKKCEKVTKHHRVRGRLCFACDVCGSHVYPQAGTILQDSRTPLHKWFHAMYLMGTTRCGISAKELERQLGVMYKTAWRMFRMIRSMMNDDVMNLLGEVEVDEAFFGGKAKNKHMSKRGTRAEEYAKKTTVFGMASREGKVIASVVPGPPSIGTIMPKVAARIMPKSVVFTDEARIYDPLTSMGYHHERVHHQANVYVRGNASTNTIESFWSLVKRGISGVHHNVSAKYLQDYINAYAFRWNRRGDETAMFRLILGQVPASQPTPTVAPRPEGSHRNLTSKMDAPF